MKHFYLAALLAALFLNSCVSEKEKSPTLPEARIDKLLPDKVMEGQPFQQQPNGASAMSILGSSLVKGSRIKMNGMPLETSSGDGTSLAALVPNEMFAKPGNFVVTVETPDGRTTNSLTWTVLAKTGPAPEIRTMHPNTTLAGKGFNVQPNGISALGMTGLNFRPGAKIFFDGKELATSFGNVDQLAAVVPPEFFQKAGKIKVTVQNPDGKTSASREFTVTQ
ncbi:IPT/TIG domain-containing protein [Bryobacter aggregatus]|uniref:IPT/TIG domain-containing protein n=1 Tax=Bryobacter aggregatus TaxID=360054 RepID=UPI0004E24417|nr:IPT/TIG domain-containing protein [Bryobacter aggregatus]